MKKRSSLNFMIAWFGFVQSLHLLALFRALIIYIKTAQLPFPALPPPQGWSPQAEHFLVGNGIIDAVNIFLSLIFVYGFFKSKPWALKTGLISLTILLYSALIFGYATINAGAWSAHPFAYWTMALLYTPIFMLTVYFFIFKTD
ncbi:MAG TPA: hypothetical protein ENN20_03410 [Candidatus Marinimicrobia bacterium]|nr:hypothetical protein [Candidatus Neomarinimicrobiota bacterium]